MVWLRSIRKFAVADPAAHCIYLVDPEGRVRRLCGDPDHPGDQNGTLAEALFRAPAHLAAAEDPEGDRGGPLGPYCLVVSDYQAHVIRWIHSSGAVETYAGEPGHAGFRKADHGSQARFNRPQGIAIIGDGKVVVADQGNHRVRLLEWDSAGSSLRVRTLAGSGASGAADGPCLTATFTELRDLCWAELEDREAVTVIDGNAVREIPLHPEGEVTTLFGSVTQAGYRDSYPPEGQKWVLGQKGPQLKDVPCLDRPISIVSVGHWLLLVLEAGNRAIRYYFPYSGHLGTFTGPSRSPEFTYGLMTRGIEGPQPPGFPFAGLGTPRALCEGPLTSGLDFALATEHRLAWVGLPIAGHATNPRSGAAQEVVAPAPSGPVAKVECTEPSGLAAPVPVWLGPCAVRFRIEPQEEADDQGVAYAVQWIEPDGSVEAVIQGRCEAGTEQLVTGRFLREGQGKVLLTWVRATGGCGARSVPVKVRREPTQ